MTEAEKTDIKWYFKPASVIVAILLMGPFAFPILWRSPAFNKSRKIIISVVVLIATIWLVKSAAELYGILLNNMKELEKVLR